MWWYGDCNKSESNQNTTFDRWLWNPSLQSGRNANDILCGTVHADKIYKKIIKESVPALKNQGGGNEKTRRKKNEDY